MTIAQTILQFIHDHETLLLFIFLVILLVVLIVSYYVQTQTGTHGTQTGTQTDDDLRLKLLYSILLDLYIISLTGVIYAFINILSNDESEYYTYLVLYTIMGLFTITSSLDIPNPIDNRQNVEYVMFALIGAFYLYIIQRMIRRIIKQYNKNLQKRRFDELHDFGGQKLSALGSIDRQLENKPLYDKNLAGSISQYMPNPNDIEATPWQSQSSFSRRSS
jgi:hypothetical protein